MNLIKKQDNKMSEAIYRSLRGRLSSSDIRTFIKSRKRFYKSCVLGERVEPEETVSTILGSIADCILTCPDKLDEKFVISTAGVPTGQVGELCDVLYKIAIRSINEEGVQTRQFEELFQEAVQEVKYKGSDGIQEMKFKGKTLEKVLELFIEPDKNGAVGELYYKEKLNSIGKTVVSINMMTSGEQFANDLKTSPYTQDIINAVTQDNSMEVYHQLMVLFTYMDIEMRAMLDITIVNHDKRTIQPADIKTSYDNENFDNTYLKGLYIQAATYDVALHKWAKEQGLDGYEILPMKYPVADTQNENMPLLYQLTTEDIRKAYNGFQLQEGHKWYPGLNECITDIKWHMETGNWKISREAFTKGGKLYLDLKYK